MKVYLDDTRQAPEGWVRCYWPDEVILLLLTGEVTELSLDHDLGDDSRGTGYDVLLWMEETVVKNGFEGGFIPPRIAIHSANPVGRQRMSIAISMIYHHFKIFCPTEYDNWIKSYITV